MFIHVLINLSSFSVVSSSQILISLLSVSDGIETTWGDTAVLVIIEVTLSTVAERTVVVVVVEVGGDAVTVIVVGVVAVAAGEGDGVREWPLCVAPCWDIVMIEPVCTYEQ